MEASTLTVPMLDVDTLNMYSMGEYWPKTTDDFTSTFYTPTKSMKKQLAHWIDKLHRYNEAEKEFEFKKVKK